ncbi:MAG TPA: thioesterase family protein, partial [Caldimonas sp.]|nr:thioesterase family protein [Caldimonas sp.]
MTAAPFEPEFVAALRTLFEQRIAFNRFIGLRIGKVAASGVEGELLTRPELIGHYTHQRLHGGVISASLDAMAGLAIMAAIGARH